MRDDLFGPPLSEAREQWIKTIEGDGGKCPCCDRWGKIYPRHINATMSRSLIWVTKNAVDLDGWINIPKAGPRFIVRSNQLPTLRWWGLVERYPSDDPAKKHSGLWRATELGKSFANNMISIPKTVFTYAGDVVEFSDERVRCPDTFNTYFDYQEVMGGNYS